MAQTVTLCQVDSVRLDLGSVAGTVQWESSTNLGNTWAAIPGANAATYETLAPDGIWYRAVVVDGTCLPVYSEVKKIQYSTLRAHAGPDNTVCTNPVPLGEFNAYTGGTGPWTYAWSPATGLSNPAVAHPIASPTTSTSYVLTVTDASGCTARDTVVIDAGGPINLPNSQTFIGVFKQPQSFVVPAGVTSIVIEVFGGRGGYLTNSPIDFGYGASLRGTFSVTPGQVLTVCPGMKGNDHGSAPSGGGGSGVSYSNAPLIIAGGAGGMGFGFEGYEGIHGSLGPNGNPGNDASFSTPTGGAGGVGGSNGGRVYYFGPYQYSCGGKGFGAGFSGSIGETGFCNNGAPVTGVYGMGGGGGTGPYPHTIQTGGAGGGGGYSGGGAGEIESHGGGGGSYNVGTNQCNSYKANATYGTVKIYW